MNHSIPDNFDVKLYMLQTFNMCYIIIWILLFAFKPIRSHGQKIFTVLFKRYFKLKEASEGVFLDPLLENCSIQVKWYKKNAVRTRLAIKVYFRVALLNMLVGSPQNL